MSRLRALILLTTIFEKKRFAKADNNSNIIVLWEVVADADLNDK